jgi:hypothetical protein
MVSVPAERLTISGSVTPGSNPDLAASPDLPQIDRPKRVAYTIKLSVYAPGEEV